MYEKSKRFTLPETVDDAVDLLISDLLTDHVDTLASLTEEQFDRFYTMVSPYILSEFRLWSGNNRLLNACMRDIGETDVNCDPAGLILRKVKERLKETHGLLIIT